MEALKVIMTTLSPAIILLLTMIIVLNWSVITAEDAIRIPKRFIRKIMNHEENAKKEVHEYYRLKKFIQSLDLPLREKELLNWSIESAEKRCIETITESTRNAILKDLRSEDENSI